MRRRAISIQPCLHAHAPTAETYRRFITRGLGRRSVPAHSRPCRRHTPAGYVPARHENGTPMVHRRLVNCTLPEKNSVQATTQRNGAVTVAFVSLFLRGKLAESTLFRAWGPLASSPSYTIKTMAIASVNPADGETLKTFAPLTDVELERRVALSYAAFREHRRTPFPRRAEWLLKAADILDAESETLGRLMTLEMGKTLKSAIAEAQKCATACRYYARARRAISGRSERRERRFPQLHPLPAAGPRAGRDALELPVLAGVPLCRTGVDGRQHRVAQTLLQRPAMRARHRGHPAASRFRRGRVPGAPDRVEPGGTAAPEIRASPPPLSPAASRPDAL